ncbi:MAG TPA: VWA domain-containing protein [Gemmata sp.]|nr:VWA domain-containing protein [Gemmata sp.]
MKVHHKQPTLVSMWMLDVFCCALGCVTLLFLLESRKAGDESLKARAEAEKNKTALIQLQDTQKQLDAALTELRETKIRLLSEEAGRAAVSAKLTEAQGLNLKLTDDVSKLGKELATAKSDRDDLAKKLALARTEAKDAKALADKTQLALNAAEAKVETDAKELALARNAAESADDILRKKMKEATDLAKKVTEMTAAADQLARLLRKRDDEKVVLVKQSAELQKKLDDMDGRVLATRKDLDAALVSAKKATDDLAAMKKAATAGEGTVKDLQKKIDDANATIIDLQGDKAKLADKYDRLQKDVEARFAGIVTSGKRVVFLVDISGSMAKKDTDTADPTKWPIVVETVGKVMRSVVGLEKYQVIVFSSSSRWLFGSGEWQEFAGEKSVERVRDALLAVKPYDDTNLYAGLERAFSLRQTGALDTVYLFSDGLPTSGPGLTVPQQTANPPLKEIERSEILGKHIRRTLNENWNRPLSTRPRVKIHAVGFFFESPDVGAFLWALARENEGSFVGMSRP